MALVKIKDYYPDYKDEVFDGKDVIGYSVYNEREEKLGNVHNILLDDSGRFRYFVVDMGFWIFGKQVLLPIGRTRMDFENDRVYAVGISQRQAEALPEYNEDITIDYDYEEQVRDTYRPTFNQNTHSEYTSETYSYDYDPKLYQYSEANQTEFATYQERLTAHKDAYTGETNMKGRLIEIKDYYPNYKDEVFEGRDLIGYSVYSDREEKVGEVHNILVDEDGRLRYFVIDTGFWIFGKKVLLPVGRTRMDFNQNRVYAIGMTEQQAKSLPEYDHDTTVDYEYEEKVRDVYRPATTAEATRTYERENYTYEHEPEMYEVNEEAHQNLKLYEERLITNKDRYKAGEVAVGKKVETETAKVSVPIEKERVVIERSSPSETTSVTPGEPDFHEGEVARVEVYEEKASIGKEAYVREEVNVRKEVERDSVDATETVRREELDVDVEGKPVIKDK